MRTYKSYGHCLTEAQRRFLSNQLGVKSEPSVNKIPLRPTRKEESEDFEYNTFLEDDESGLDVDPNN